MKKIYDAVHHFIRFNELEQQLIDAEPFQRLHYVHQLGIAFLVYPGATHSRFEHSLGTMEIATQIFDRLAFKFPHPEQDYWRQIIRLAALCHDLGHLPFSHVAEKALLGKEGHEKWTLRVIESEWLAPIWERLGLQFPGKDIVSDVAKMAIGEEKLQFLGGTTPFSAWEKVMCQVITGDFFGADRIDYLLRDAQCTGVSYGLFDYHQLIEMIAIVPAFSGKQWQLGIEESGVASCEALLLARHFMHERVYHHSSVKAYTFHLARFMQKYYEENGCLDDLSSYLSVTDNEILTAVRQAAKKGDPDAQALMKRTSKFLAISVESELLENQIASLQDKLQIPSDKLFCAFQGQEKSQGLSFPVKLSSGDVVDVNTRSRIFIPAHPKNWIYVAVEYGEGLREELK